MGEEEKDLSVDLETKKSTRGKTKKEQALNKEYEDSFSGEEKMLHKLINIKSTINITMKEIEIDDIIISNFKKISRDKTLTGLAGVVGEWGVVSPIHVLALEDDGCYQLLEGLRRVFAAARNNKKTITAMVWDFTDKSEGKELANILSLMINRSQKYNATEMWEQMKLLESVNDASPGLIEYLLQMESGDAMKLKDVMLSDADYADAKEGLLSGKYTIEAAYKKLCNMRKKENKLEKEDGMSIDNDGLKQASTGADSESGAEEGTDDGGEEAPKKVEKLSVGDVKELLELSDEKDIENEDLEDLDKTAEIRGNVVQDTKHRTYIDSSVKQNTLIRDDFKCRCCGLDGKNGMYLGVLVYHHAIPVYCGGPDTVENGLTLCANCHLTLHNYLMGKVQVNKDELSESELKIFKNIFKFGNIALEAQKKAGISKQKADKLDAPSRQHMRPGVGVTENKQALEQALASEKTTEGDNDIEE